MPDRPIPPIPPGSTPCRELLRALRDALRLPYPAGKPDEHAYYVLRSKRCGLALEAIDRILTDRGADNRDLLTEAEVLRLHVRDLPPDGYEHSGLSW
jgi:hypothetical protein